MPDRIVYASRTPEGAGQVPAGFTPERAPAPPCRGVCFANMPNVNALQAMVSSAPPDTTRDIISLAAKRGRELSGQLERMVPRTSIHASGRKSIRMGSRVKDIKTGRKGVVIHAACAYTEHNTPIHKICDKNGNTWKQKERHLELR